MFLDRRLLSLLIVVITSTGLAEAQQSSLHALIDSYLPSCQTELKLKQQYIQHLIEQKTQMLKSTINQIPSEKWGVLRSIEQSGDVNSDGRLYVDAESGQTAVTILNDALEAAGYITNPKKQMRTDKRFEYAETRFDDLDHMFMLPMTKYMVFENAVYLMSKGRLGFELLLETKSPVLPFYRMAAITIDGVSRDSTQPIVYVSVRSPSVVNISVDDYLKDELASCIQNRETWLELNKRLFGKGGSL
jgi:hypothetical protein